MTKLVHEKIATGEARVVDAPSTKEVPRHQVEIDRNFELPSALFGVTVGLYLAFLGVMLLAFASPGLAIPMVIFAAFILAGFGVPAIWTRLADNRTKPMSFGAFRKAGIMTNTGRCAPRDAVIQMLILPVLIVLWACVVAIIAAVVS